MKKLLILFLLIFPCQSFAEEVLTLKIKIHLVENMAMTKDGVAMQNWITQQMISDEVMPEINRIWQQADIKWQLDSVEKTQAQGGNIQEVIDYVSNSSREDAEDERIKKLNSIFPFKAQDQKLINVYVIPYLGATYQGNAQKNKKRVFIAQWSNKFSNGKLPPEKVLLVEKGEFKKGSFARTLSHELGHILGLIHPDKQFQIEKHRLMGGKKPGYLLTSSEITSARENAKLLQ